MSKQFTKKELKLIATCFQEALCNMIYDENISERQSKREHNELIPVYKKAQKLSGITFSIQHEMRK